MDRTSARATREAIDGYFARLAEKRGWEALFSDDVVFTSFTSPIKRIAGKEAFLDATRRFYASIAAVEVRDVMVDGQRACALTRYRIQRPGAPAFESDVAEVFEVRDGRIRSLGIYFDTAPFPK